MSKVAYILLSATVCVILSCSTSPDFPDAPLIDFISVSQTEFDQNYQDPLQMEDTIYYTLGFMDGDGDLGDIDNAKDIEFTDSRTGFKVFNSIPMLPVQGSGNGVEGEMVIASIIFPGQDFCCVPPSGTGCRPDPSFPQDTFRFTIRIQDRAGNWSNEVSTPTLTINCN